MQYIILLVDNSCMQGSEWNKIKIKITPWTPKQNKKFFNSCVPTMSTYYKLHYSFQHPNNSINITICQCLQVSHYHNTHCIIGNSESGILLFWILQWIIVHIFRLGSLICESAHSSSPACKLIRNKSNHHVSFLGPALEKVIINCTIDISFNSMANFQLTRWRLVPNILGLESMGNACHSKFKSSSMG